MGQDKCVRTYSISSRGFYCERCNAIRGSINTTIRVYASGIEVQIDHCDDCGQEQQTEFFKGPTIRIETKE